MCSIGEASTAGDGGRRVVGVGVTLLLHVTLGWAAWTGLDTPAQTVPVPLEVRFIEAPRAPGPLAPVVPAPPTSAEAMPPPAAEPPPPEPLAQAPAVQPEPEHEPEPMPEPELAVASPVAEHEAEPRVERAPAPPMHARKKPPAKPKPMRKAEARRAIEKPSVDDPRPVEKVEPKPVDPSPVVAHAQPAPAPAVTAPVAAAPMLAAAAPAVPIRAPRFDAAYLRNPPPAYPRASRRLGEEGRVVLRVRVESDGRPSQLAVQASSGSARLDDAAFDAVRRWRFVAARRGDESVAAWVLVPIEFRLNDS